MQWIICYDISHTRSRTQACRTLRRYSLGYQKSGFEIPELHSTDFQALTQSLGSLLDDMQDSLLLLRHSKAGPDWQIGAGITNSSGLLSIS